MILALNASPENDSHMNLQRCDDEVRFEMQQIEAARADDEELSPNPFAAVPGIAVIVAVIALLFLVERMIETLVGSARYVAEGAFRLVHSIHSAHWLAKEAFEPGTKIALASIAALFFILACRFALRVSAAISGFARRRRA